MAHDKNWPGWSDIAATNFKTAPFEGATTSWLAHPGGTLVTSRCGPKNRPPVGGFGLLTMYG